MQAADLIGRKIARDQGQAIYRVIERMRALEHKLGQPAWSEVDDLQVIRKALHGGIQAVVKAVQYIVSEYGSDVQKVSVGAVPFLGKLFKTQRSLVMGVT